MLRVDASNLPNPRGALRPRRLLPNPPSTSRRASSASRHEIVPPRDESNPPTTELLLPHPEPDRVGERWSVRLELRDEDIAKLYGQGLTRGAVVWKKGMLEWRPLLITPELSGLLRRTRTTLTELPITPELVSSSEELTLPRPARVPSSIVPAALANQPVTPTTVAPIAIDIEPGEKSIEPSPRTRRAIELAAVGAAAFALAWIGRSHLHPPNDAATPPASLAAAATSPAARPPACEPATAKATSTSGSSIPTVSIADLPLIGASRSLVRPTTTGARTSRSIRSSSSSSNAAPSRSELMAALSRVASVAGGCGERGGPVRLVMSFSGSGVARSIQVSGPGLPAPTRSCIIGAASRARVPTFSGSPVTVSKTL